MLLIRSKQGEDHKLLLCLDETGFQFCCTEAAEDKKKKGVKKTGFRTFCKPHRLQNTHPNSPENIPVSCNTAITKNNPFYRKHKDYIWLRAQVQVEEVYVNAFLLGLSGDACLVQYVANYEIK